MDDPAYTTSGNNASSGEPDAQDPEGGQLLSPVSGRARSPIRPEHPDPPRPRLVPNLHRPTRPELPVIRLERNESLPPDQEADEALTPAQKAERALESLRQKIQDLVQEYAEGKINQATFNAIYRRYAEQREITERLVERNPGSAAWQAVIQSGHTGFLRDHYAAKLLSYGLYRIDTGEQIVLQGTLRLPAAQLDPIFTKLRRLAAEARVAKPAWRKLKDGRWVMLAPGRYTASVVIFSLEPAITQRETVEDVQRDFERANEKVISRGDFDASRLVFPHRALFE
ncbi:MAG: hypothetical protein HC915_09345 [Anaerolineae bacterium]|nr:hypothetical protein [Anaerolineae bacterium]